MLSFSRFSQGESSHFANHRCGYPQSACKLLGVLFLNDTRKPNVPLGAAAFIGEHDQLIPKMRVVLDKQSKTMLLGRHPFLLDRSFTLALFQALTRLPPLAMLGKAA